MKFCVYTLIFLLHPACQKSGKDNTESNFEVGIKVGEKVAQKIDEQKATEDSPLPTDQTAIVEDDTFAINAKVSIEPTPTDQAAQPEIIGIYNIRSVDASGTEITAEDLLKSFRVVLKLPSAIKPELIQISLLDQNQNNEITIADSDYALLRLPDESWELSFYSHLPNATVVVKELESNSKASGDSNESMESGENETDKKEESTNPENKAENDIQQSDETTNESSNPDSSQEPEINPVTDSEPDPILFSYSNPTILFSDITSRNYLPSHNKGNEPIVWSISPALPASLQFEPSTGKISGVLNTSTSAVGYTVTASLGTLSTNIQITIAPFFEFFLMDSDDVGEFQDGTKTNVVWDSNKLRLQPIANYQLSGISTLGLKSYFAMDDSGTIASGESLTPLISSEGGTFGGSTLNYGIGKMGNALLFTGNSYIQFPDAYDNDTNSSKTVAFWAKLSGTNATTIASKWGGSLTSNHAWRIHYDSGVTNLRFTIRGSSGEVSSPGTSALATNRWYHIAGVFDSGASVTLYLDGKEVGSTTSSVPASTNSGWTIRIGQRGNDSERFSGSLDEYSFWTRALDPTEIESLYKKNKDKFTGSYVSGIIDSQSSVSKWESINWNALEPYSRSLPLPSNSENQYDSENADSAILQEIVLMADFDGQVGESPTSELLSDRILDENPAIIDANSSLAFEDGMVHNALQLEASDYLTFSNRNSLEQQDLSISFWMKTPNPTNAQVVLDYRGDNGSIATSGWAFELNSTFGNCNNTNLCFIGSLNDDTATNSHYGVHATIFENKWHHIVLTSNQTSNRRRIYVDTELVFETFAAQGIGFHDESLFVGADFGGNNGFAGSLDQLILWNKEISSTIVEKIYNRGIQKISFQIQTCNTNSCIGEGWFGPDGTSSTYFTDQNLVPNGPISFGSGLDIQKRYFRYKADFESYSVDQLPAFDQVEIRSGLQ